MHAAGRAEDEFVPVGPRGGPELQARPGDGRRDRLGGGALGEPEVGRRLERFGPAADDRLERLADDLVGVRGPQPEHAGEDFGVREAAVQRGDQRLGDGDGPVGEAGVAPAFQRVCGGDVPAAQQARLVAVLGDVAGGLHLRQRRGEVRVGGRVVGRVPAEDQQRLDLTRRPSPATTRGSPCAPSGRSASASSRNDSPAAPSRSLSAWTRACTAAGWREPQKHELLLRAVARGRRRGPRGTGRRRPPFRPRRGPLPASPGTPGRACSSAAAGGRRRPRCC